MTDLTARPRTVREVEMRPKDRAIERAAARAVSRAGGLLHEAFRASGMTQKDLATMLNVSEGRVSQVLGGDQNMYVTTLARYLGAMGYQLELNAEGISEGARQIGVRRRRGAANGPVGVYRHNNTAPFDGAKAVTLVQRDTEEPRLTYGERGDFRAEYVGDVDPGSSQLKLKMPSSSQGANGRWLRQVGGSK